MKQRAGACHDEYGFSAKLGLDPVAEGMPVLRYQTVATRFPAGVSRFEDSLAKGPLKKKDLRTEQDPACSYTRLFRLVMGCSTPTRRCRTVRGIPNPTCSVEPCSTGVSVEPSLRSAVTKRSRAWARLYSYSQRVAVMMLSLSTYAQAILADVLGGDGAGADRVDQAGAALAGQAADVGFVGRLADCPAQLAGIAVAGTLDLRARVLTQADSSRADAGSSRDRRKADMRALLRREDGRNDSTRRAKGVSTPVIAGTAWSLHSGRDGWQHASGQAGPFRCRCWIRYDGRQFARQAQGEGYWRCRCWAWRLPPLPSNRRRTPLRKRRCSVPGATCRPRQATHPLSATWRSRCCRRPPLVAIDSPLSIVRASARCVLPAGGQPVAGRGRTARAIPPATGLGDRPQQWPQPGTPTCRTSMRCSAWMSWLTMVSPMCRGL